MTHAQIAAQARKPYADKIMELVAERDALRAALLDQINTGEELRDALRSKILASQYDEVLEFVKACLHSRDRARAALAQAQEVQHG